MKFLIFSLFFLLINRGVLANEEKVCRFDLTKNWEYEKIQSVVSGQIRKVVNEWLREKEILIKGEIKSSASITQRFTHMDSSFSFPRLRLMPEFSLITDKEQHLCTLSGRSDSYYIPPDYEIEYVSLILRDNQGIPLKKGCQIRAKENIILQIYNANQSFDLDKIILYKKGDLIYQFKDEQESSSSVFEVEEMD